MLLLLQGVVSCKKRHEKVVKDIFVNCTTVVRILKLYADVESNDEP